MMAPVRRSNVDLVVTRTNRSEKTHSGAGCLDSALVSRRDLLIDTTLDVIAEHGVAGTTHRRVAAAAGVPLGSTTYYFADLHDLLGAAFERFADQISDRFEARLAPAESAVEALDAITDFLLHDVDSRELALSFELYAYAIRRPVVAGLVEAWFARSQRALTPHFDPVTARSVDTFVEGMLTYRGLASDRSDRAEIRRGLALLTGLDGSEKGT